MRSYRVTSPHRVLDHAPGETFDADLDPVQEERLLQGGHLASADESDRREDDDPEQWAEPPEASKE